MSIRSTIVGFALPPIVVLAIGFPSPAEADVFVRSTAKVKVQPPTVVEVAKTVTVLKGEPVEELIAPGTRAPHISYRDHGPQRLKCCGTITVHLSIQDPCKGCLYDVPVCLPECCSEPPRVVVERAGAHGRVTGTYVWCCGYKVKIILDRCGEITVHTIGR